MGTVRAGETAGHTHHRDLIVPALDTHLLVLSSSHIAFPRRAPRSMK
jgi:hypothetical protein